MSTEVRLRQATANDVPALAALYADCARRLGPQVYTPQQVDAWARFALDGAAFRDYVLQPRTWVLEPHGLDAPLLGFCGVQPDGEVRSLYVRVGHTRQGLGTRLLAHVLADARATHGLRDFQAWATPFSRPVFERQGFRLVRTVEEPFEGVLFERYRMATR